MKLIIAQFTVCTYFSGKSWFSILREKGNRDKLYSKMGFRKL